MERGEDRKIEKAVEGGIGKTQQSQTTFLTHGSTNRKELFPMCSAVEGYPVERSSLQEEGNYIQKNLEFLFVYVDYNIKSYALPYLYGTGLNGSTSLYSVIV